MFVKDVSVLIGDPVRGDSYHCLLLHLNRLVIAETTKKHFNKNSFAILLRGPRWYILAFGFVTVFFRPYVKLA